MSQRQEIDATQEKESRVEVAYGLTQEELDAPAIPGFEEGPTRLEIEQWKEKYGSIYFTPFDDEIYIWRILQRQEYNAIISDRQLTALDREEIFTEKCVLYPRNYTREKMKEGKAGVPTLLNEMIMDKSGFIAQSAPIKL